MNKLKKGDKVKVLLGKDRGSEGTIERLVAKTGEVYVTGVNVYKRHIRRSLTGTGEGTVVDVIKPMKLSNLALLCPNCKKPTRVGFNVDKGKKVRICRKCKKVI